MIKQFHVKNFKSLADVRVDLDPVTVLIGRSGTGKSNFVESLRFLRDYLVYRGDAALQHYGDWARVLSATTPAPMELSFAVRFDAPGFAEDFEYTLILQQHARQTAPVLREEKLSLGARVLFHQDQRIPGWVQEPPIINPPPAGSLMLGALTGFQEVSVAYLILTNGLACYAFPDTVLLQPGGSDRRNETGLSDDGRTFLQAFNDIANNLQAWIHRKEMVAALRQLDRSIKSIELQMPDRSRIVVSHDVGGRLLVLDVAQESEGLRRFLAHLIAFYQTPPKQTLIFEEPEKGIHPGGLAVLAEEVKACPTQERGQVILTTHSPELLNHFAPETLRVVDIHNYETRIGPVAPEQVEALRDHLLFPGELLTVDPARLPNSLASAG
jgi:predicted ATPase